MISDRLFTFVDFILPLSSFLGALPYTWDTKAHKVIRSSHSDFYCRIHFFHLRVVFILSFFLILYFYNVEHNLDNFNLLFAGELGLALILQFWYLMICLEDEAITMCNSLVFYLQFMNKKYLPSYDPNNSNFSKLVELILLWIFAGHCGACVLSCIAICLYPNTPLFITYVVPEDAPLSLRLPISYFTPCLYFCILFLNLFDCLGAVFGYGVFVVPFVVQEFRMGRASYKSVPELREPENLILAYRTIQLLQLQIFGVLGQFLVPTQTIITKLVIFSAYMVIKHGNQIKLIAWFVLISWSTIAMVFWVCVLVMGGYLHLYGNKVLKSWKRYPWSTKYERALMNKFRRSCQPIQMNFGKTYGITRLTVLKFLRSSSRGILRALLTL